MPPRSVALALLFGLTALIIQRSGLAPLHLPGATPDLLILVVVAFAVKRGPSLGCVVGFLLGLLADLAPPADHGVGRVALVFTLAGYLAGLTRDEAERSVLVPVVVVAFAAAFVVAMDAGVGVVFGDSRVTWPFIARELPASVLYDVLLAPFLLPLVAFADRRLDREYRRP